MCSSSMCMEAVLAAEEPESGITVHLVNEHHDEGEHLFQARCPVPPDDRRTVWPSASSELEHRHYLQVVEKLAEALPAAINQHGTWPMFDTWMQMTVRPSSCSRRH